MTVTFRISGFLKTGFMIRLYRMSCRITVRHPRPRPKPLLRIVNAIQDNLSYMVSGTMAATGYTHKLSPHSSHTLLLDSLPREGHGRRVLDVGCASGYL